MKLSNFEDDVLHMNTAAMGNSIIFENKDDLNTALCATHKDQKIYLGGRVMTISHPTHLEAEYFIVTISLAKAFNGKNKKTGASERRVIAVPGEDVDLSKAFTDSTTGVTKTIFRDVKDGQTSNWRSDELVYLIEVTKDNVCRDTVVIRLEVKPEDVVGKTFDSIFSSMIQKRIEDAENARYDERMKKEAEYISGNAEAKK